MVYHLLFNVDFNNNSPFLHLSTELKLSAKCLLHFELMVIVNLPIVCCRVKVQLYLHHKCLYKTQKCLVTNMLSCNIEKVIVIFIKFRELIWKHTSFVIRISFALLCISWGIWNNALWDSFKNIRWIFWT